jgi:hypothetical protein
MPGSLCEATPTASRSPVTSIIAVQEAGWMAKIDAGMGGRGDAASGGNDGGQLVVRARRRSRKTPCVVAGGVRSVCVAV